jgi:DNA (cytosine-5)-methyltransferase 1
VRPRLLDLFCGAGGAAVGYDRAGFDVVGVDIRPQPRYPFEFVQADVMALTPFDMHDYDAIHASPPCHDHSTVTGRNRKAVGPKGTGWMLGATIDLLAATGRPFVIENVETAEFPRSVFRLRLCGSSFGLDVRRHRWFAANVAMLAPAREHHWQRPRFRSLDSRRETLASVVGVHGHLNYAGEAEVRNQAMGIEWMNQAELAQAIPPAYTQFIGEYLLAELAVAVAP